MSELRNLQILQSVRVLTRENRFKWSPELVLKVYQTHLLTLWSVIVHKIKQIIKYNGKYTQKTEFPGDKTLKLWF